MEWADEGIILAVNPHGENHAVVEAFTPSAGRVAALVHGGQGRSKQPIVQPGNSVELIWKGRGENSLGHFVLELTIPRAAALMQSSTGLSALASVTSLLSICLPERQSIPRLYDATKIILDLLEEESIWPALLVKWELGLLKSLGFGLSLNQCVATGHSLEDGADLVFVSPKSGGAVSYDAGLPYRDKMFALPPFVIDRGEPRWDDILAGLRLTEHFIEERILAPANRDLPAARNRLYAKLARA